jgi:hypothetical protein
MFKSTIAWYFIFVYQYYNFPTEFLGEKVGQVVQAPHQLVLRSCSETNRFKIGLVHWIKRLHQTIFPLPVEVGNQEFEVRKHFLPRPAGEILLRVNELSEQFGGKNTRALKSQKITGYLPMCSVQISCLDVISTRPSKSRCGLGSSFRGMEKKELVKML